MILGKDPGASSYELTEESILAAEGGAAEMLTGQPAKLENGTFAHRVDLRDFVAVEINGGVDAVRDDLSICALEVATVRNSGDGLDFDLAHGVIPLLFLL